jgi:L-alanine-DL-glutamate epimerase-like enolase superfamily enzyme
MPGGEGGGFKGSKVKIGKPTAAEDVARLSALRDAVGPSYEIMTDANQGFLRDSARRRAHALSDLDLAWIEEPLAADDIEGHAELAASRPCQSRWGSRSTPSVTSPNTSHAARLLIQVDVGRIGGITPWLKVAHMAECHGLAVAPTS